MLSLQKNLFFSLFSAPNFLIRKKRHKRRGTFLKRGSNSLKWTYVEEGIHVKRTGMNKGGGGGGGEKKLEF